MKSVINPPEVPIDHLPKVGDREDFDVQVIDSTMSMYMSSQNVNVEYHGLAMAPVSCDDGDTEYRLVSA